MLSLWKEKEVYIIIQINRASNTSISTSFIAERRPLLVAAGRANRGRYWDVIFHTFCFLSGQFMFDSMGNGEDKWKSVLIFVEIPLMLLSFVFNLGVVIFDCNVIFTCPYSNCAYIAGPYQVSLVNLTSSSFPANMLLQYVNMQKVVFTLATLSGSISYSIMMYILITHYSPLHRKYYEIKQRIKYHLKQCNSQDDDNRENPPARKKILSPFPVSEDNRAEFEALVLPFPQQWSFYFLFFINILLLGASVGTLSKIMSDENEIRRRNTQTTLGGFKQERFYI